MQMAVSTRMHQSHERKEKSLLERTIIEAEGSEANQEASFDWLAGRAAVIQALSGSPRLFPPQRRNYRTFNGSRSTETGGQAQIATR